MMVSGVERTRGVTIIEALIAIAVIGIVFAALAATQISNLRVTTESRDDSTVLQAAVQGFEIARTRVLEDFQAYIEGCREPKAANCTESNLRVPVGNRDSRVSVRYELTSGSPLANSETLWLVLIEVTAELVSSGQSFTLRQFVSCLDALDQPTMVNATACGTVLPPPPSPPPPDDSGTGDGG